MDGVATLFIRCDQGYKQGKIVFFSDLVTFCFLPKFMLAVCLSAAKSHNDGKQRSSPCLYSWM